MRERSGAGARTVTATMPPNAFSVRAYDAFNCAGAANATAKMLQHTRKVAGQTAQFKTALHANSTECATAWACTASRIIEHDRAAGRFVIRPRAGAACNTNLVLSDDAGTSAELMRSFGPDGWELFAEGHELAHALGRHHGGCIYTAEYHIGRSGRYRLSIAQTHQGSGAAVDESTPVWHKMQFVVVHSSWEHLSTRRMPAFPGCSPWGRWVWPYDNNEPWVREEVRPCFGGGNFAGFDAMPWALNLTHFEWRAFPRCEPSHLKGWQLLDGPERVHACLRSTQDPKRQTTTSALFLGDSQVRTIFESLPGRTPLAAAASGKAAAQSTLGAVSTRSCYGEDVYAEATSHDPDPEPGTQRMGLRLKYSCERVKLCLEHDQHDGPILASIVQWGENRAMSIQQHKFKGLNDTNAVPYRQRIDAPWCGPTFAGASALIMGCQNHPASGAHWTLEQYRTFIHELAMNHTREHLLHSPVVWLEGHSLPVRQGPRRVSKDWRTSQRAQVFNRVATAAMTAAGARVVPLGVMSAAIAEASMDGAHPNPFAAATFARMALAATCPQYASSLVVASDG